jgi:hypothetical protein
MSLWFRGGRIHTHELLERALWLLDRAPLAILWLDFVVYQSFMEAKKANYTLKITQTG